MSYQVLKVNERSVELWDRTSKDEWKRPATFTVGLDPSGIAVDDLVDLAVRVVGHVEAPR